MRQLLVCLMAALSLGLHAQDWGQQWICAPWADGEQQVWFCRDFDLSAAPRRLMADVASSGHFMLYVNGRNATTRLLEPFCQQGADSIWIVSYDLTPFVRRGKNTLCVWFSPTCGSRKQLSLTLWGTVGKGAFALSTDERWRCAPAHALTRPDGSELTDGRYHILRPTPTATWQPAVRPQGEPRSRLLAGRQPEMPYRVRQYACCLAENDTTDTTVCVFTCGLRLEGRVRVTLTGMHAGDTVRLNRHRYICSGKDGEQAMPRFGRGEAGLVRIEGPRGFTRRNIDGTPEAVLLEPEPWPRLVPYPPRGNKRGVRPVEWLDQADDEP